MNPNSGTVIEKGRAIEYYAGKSTLKAAGQGIPYTKEEVKELKKCKNDPIYFIRNYSYIVSEDEGFVKFDLFDYQEEFINLVHENRKTVARWCRQSGKALSLDTPIPTPDGWSTMGNIMKGDYILGADGKPTKVTFVTETMYEHDCYKITFDNGEEIIADRDHLWNVGHRYWKHNIRTLTTEELVKKYNEVKDVKTVGSLYVPISEPVDLPEKELPIDPYSLGVWLGDGSAKAAKVYGNYSDLSEIASILEERGQCHNGFKKDGEGDNVSIWLNGGFYRTLNEEDLFGNKHIPKQYLRGSIEQRIDLLRGLMDTDGYCKYDSGSCEFFQKDPNIIESFRELLSSLGIKSRVRGKEIGGEWYYTVSFSTTRFYVFNLQRKRERQDYCLGHPKNTRLYISNIEKVDSVPVRCLKVDNKDNLFLIGNTFIPTHNSTVMAAGYFLYFILFNDHKTVGILANKESTAKEILSRLKRAYEALPFWMQAGVTKWNETSIELENGSSAFAAATSSDAIRGWTISALLLDEAAHIEPKKWEEFYTSVYPTITTGKNSKIIITSTPKGFNHYYKIYNDAENRRNGFIPYTITWRNVPGRDWKWAEETKADIGEQKFNQEHEVAFLGSSNTLISPDTLSNLSFNDPVYNHKNIKIYEYPEKDKIYVMTVDVSHGKEQDKSAINIVDITDYPFRQVATVYSDSIPPIALPDLIYELGVYYNHAYVLVENNDRGYQVLHILNSDLEYENILSPGNGTKKYELGLRETTVTKRIGCNTLKDLIETEKLIIQDDNTITELFGFIANNKGSYEADNGYNDDLVMSLVIFAWLTTQNYFEDLTDKNTRRMLASQRIEEIEEDLAPLPVIDNGLSDDDDMFETWEETWETFDSRLFGKNY